MSPDAIFVLVVTAAVVWLFVSGWIPVDQVAIAVPAALLAGGVLDLETALSGLANPATIAVASFLVIGLGLDKTGVVDAIGRMSNRWRVGSPAVRMLAMCVVVAAISPFLSNTAVVVVFLPVFLAMAKNTGQAPSRVLIPLSYAAILGGTLTLIGTSTNLVVHNEARNRGFGDLSMFSIAPLGLIYLATGFAYLATLGRRLLPERPSGNALTAAATSRLYTTELTVTEDSPAAGADPRRLDWTERYGLSGVYAQRGWYGLGPHALSPGDVLSVTGPAQQIFDCARAEQLETPSGRMKAKLQAEGEPRIVELMIAPGGAFVGRTIEELRIASRFDAVVLAVQRPRRPLLRRMTRERLAGGDLLLVQGSADALAALIDHDAFVAIGEQPRHDRTRAPAWVALGILVATTAVAATGVAPIASAALVGAVAMVFACCVRLDELYRELDWPVVALLAGLLPLGVALDSSGAAAHMATSLANLLEGAHPCVVVGCFYLVTSLLTEVMSNQAAAVVLTPLAITTAERLDMNPYALIVAVMFGASAAFMTPTGYQTNALVYGPGGYRFSDYVRVGAPLNLILTVVAALAIPAMWP